MFNMVWILPCVKPHGGVKVIFEIAKSLRKFGYKILIISMDKTNYEEWYGSVPFTILQSDNKYYIKDYCNNNLNITYLFATGWQTAHLVNEIVADKKFYFIQDYEPWFCNTINEQLRLGISLDHKVEDTYKLPLTKFVVAKWLKIKIEKLYNSECILLPMGATLLGKKFLPRKYTAPLTLGAMVMDEKPARNPELLKKVLVQLAKTDLTIIAFGGMTKKTEELFKANNIQSLGFLKIKELFKLYEKLDLIIDASKFRGTSVIGQESSQFGTVLFATYPVLGMLEHGYIDKENFVSIKEDVNDICEKVESVVNCSSYFEYLSKNTINYSDTLDWIWTASEIHKIISN